MVSQAEQSFEALDPKTEQQPLPPKKGLQKWLPPGFAALPAAGRKKIIFLTLFIVGSGLFMFRHVIWNEQQEPVVQETTADDLAGSVIKQGGKAVKPTTNTEPVVAQMQAKSADMAEYGEDKGYSGLEDVRFSHWMTQEEDPSLKFQPPLPKDEGATVGAASQGATGVQAQSINIDEVSGWLTADLVSSRQISGAPTAIPAQTAQPAAPQQGATSRQNLRNKQSEIAASQREKTIGGEPSSPSTSTKLRHILPGDQLICQVLKAINSDVSRQTNCTVRGSNLDGARITLKIKREGDYLFIDGTNLVFGNNFVPLTGAIAVDTGDVAANGLRDDVDYHRLVRWSALLLAGGGEAVTDLVGQPKMRQTTTATQSTWESIEASDSDILKAALARPAAIAKEELLQTFRMPPTVYLDKDRIVHIYFMTAVTAPWMPDMTSKLRQSFQLREYN